MLNQLSLAKKQPRNKRQLKPTKCLKAAAAAIEASLAPLGACFASTVDRQQGSWANRNVWMKLLVHVGPRLNFHASSAMSAQVCLTYAFAHRTCRTEDVKESTSQHRNGIQPACKVSSGHMAGSLQRGGGPSPSCWQNTEAKVSLLAGRTTSYWGAPFLAAYFVGCKCFVLPWLWSKWCRVRCSAFFLSHTAGGWRSPWPLQATTPIANPRSRPRRAICPPWKNTHKRMKGRNGLCLNFTFDLRCPEPSRIQRAAAKLKMQKTSRLRRAAKHLFAELVLARDTIEDTKHGVM